MNIDYLSYVFITSSLAAAPLSKFSIPLSVWKTSETANAKWWEQCLKNYSITADYIKHIAKNISPCKIEYDKLNIWYKN